MEDAWEDTGMKVYEDDMISMIDMWMVFAVGVLAIQAIELNYYYVS